MKNNLTADVKKTEKGLVVSIYRLKPISYCVYSTLISQKIELIAPNDNCLHYSYNTGYKQFGSNIIYLEIDLRNDVCILLYDCDKKNEARILFKQNYSKLEYET